MLTLSPNPLSQDRLSKLDNWLRGAEADTLTAVVRAQMARMQIEAIKGLDGRSAAILANNQLDAATVSQIRDAARLGVFLEVWKDIASGQIDLSLIRIDVS